MQALKMLYIPPVRRKWQMAEKLLRLTVVNGGSTAHRDVKEDSIYFGRETLNMRFWRLDELIIL